MLVYSLSVVCGRTQTFGVSIQLFSYHWLELGLKAVNEVRYISHRFRHIKKSRFQRRIILNGALFRYRQINIRRIIINVVLILREVHQPVLDFGVRLPFHKCVF